MIKFGTAIDSKRADADELVANIEKALDFSDQVVELSLTKISKVIYSTRASNLLKKFKYRSIHLPVLNDGKFISYPDPSIEKEMKIIDQFIEDISPQTVLVHPDQVRDFGWVVNKYGSRLAFENMDSKKKFGKTVEDMEIVFNKCPKAKWVFDLNHIYTNDNSMSLAKDFFARFKNRLTHYHISGYGGFHDALCLSHEDVIIKGLLSLNYPIVDEGNLLSKDVLREEFNYITERLKTVIK